MFHGCQRPNVFAEMKYAVTMADALSPAMTLREFENGYWYLEQLKNFAERIGIPAAKKLRKDELEKAIVTFLVTGKVALPTKRFHTFWLVQDGNKVTGSHQGEFQKRDMMGTIDGDTVVFTSSMTGHGDSEHFLGDLLFRFDGKIQGDTMSGPLDMGEYLGAKWSAKRYVPHRTSGAQEG